MKRKTKLLNSVAILFVVGTVSIVSVNAANNGDTGYTYNFSALDQYKTDFRLKEDKSSVYMYCQSASSAYRARVYGGNANGHAIDCSNGYQYRFVAGTKRFMYNYVKEWGYSRAAVFATIGNGVANGVWSPDSIPQSGVLPPSDYIK